MREWLVDGGRDNVKEEDLWYDLVALGEVEFRGGGFCRIRRRPLSRSSLNSCQSKDPDLGYTARGDLHVTVDPSRPSI